MKTLPYPQIDNIDLWDKIVTHKHQTARGKLLPLRDNVIVNAINNCTCNFRE